MNNEDKQLLEDFTGWLVKENIALGLMTNTEAKTLVEQFMLSPYYEERPVEVISTTNIPAPHFNMPKITL